MTKKRGTRAGRGGGTRTVIFGRVLAALRVDRGKRASLEALSEDLGRLGVSISGSALHRFETDGRIPDAIVLDGLARLYRISREQLLDVLVSDVQGDAIKSPEIVAADLLRHTREIQTHLLDKKEGADRVLSAADARLLAQRLEEFESYAHELQTVLIEITDTAERSVRAARSTLGRQQARTAAPPKADDSGND